MAVNSHAAKSALLSPAGSLGGFWGLANFGRRALAGVTSAIRSIQTARMVSTLANMSDEQLAALSIERADIRRHAEDLMARDAA